MLIGDETEMTATDLDDGDLEVDRVRAEIELPDHWPLLIVRYSQNKSLHGHLRHSAVYRRALLS
jgi:hypothetical protein